MLIVFKSASNHDCLRRGIQPIVNISLSPSKSYKDYERIRT